MCQSITVKNLSFPLSLPPLICIHYLSSLPPSVNTHYASVPFTGQSCVSPSLWRICPFLSPSIALHTIPFLSPSISQYTLCICTIHGPSRICPFLSPSINQYMLCICLIQWSSQSHPSCIRPSLWRTCLLLKQCAFVSHPPTLCASICVWRTCPFLPPLISMHYRQYIHPSIIRQSITVKNLFFHASFLLSINMQYASISFTHPSCINPSLRRICLSFPPLICMHYAPVSSTHPSCISPLCEESVISSFSPLISMHFPSSLPPSVCIHYVYVSVSSVHPSWISPSLWRICPSFPLLICTHYRSVSSTYPSCISPPLWGICSFLPLSMDPYAQPFLSPAYRWFNLYALCVSLTHPSVMDPFITVKYLSDLSHPSIHHTSVHYC